jgi:uncharacterized protein (UPF0333 family)
MTEYIIIVAVIAIAAIGAFAYFGRTVEDQTAAMSSSLAGDQAGADAAVGDAKTDAGAAATAAQKEVDLSNYVDRGTAGGS